MYNASRYFLCEPFSIIQTTKYFLLNKDNRFKAPITTCKLSLSPFIITITLEKLMYIFLYQDKKSDLMGLTNGQWIEENWAWNHFNRCIPSGNCSLSKNKKKEERELISKSSAISDEGEQLQIYAQCTEVFVQFVYT